jgi:hypothetical protein
MLFAQELLLIGKRLGEPIHVRPRIAASRQLYWQLKLVCRQTPLSWSSCLKNLKEKNINWRICYGRNKIRWKCSKTDRRKLAAELHWICVALIISCVRLCWIVFELVSLITVQLARILRLQYEIPLPIMPAGILGYLIGPSETVGIRTYEFDIRSHSNIPHTWE